MDLLHPGRMGPDDLDIQARFHKLRDILGQILFGGKNAESGRAATREHRHRGQLLETVDQSLHHRL